MEKKKYENSMLRDWKKVLERCFSQGFADKTIFPREDLEMDHLIEIKEVKQEDLPPALQFIKEKAVLLCEAKTPGDYLDLSVFRQMLDCQATYMYYLEKNRRLKREVFKEVVVIVLVSQFSKSMKDWLRKERGVEHHEVETGVHRFPLIMDHYALVLDELEIDLATIELLKYTKNPDRILEIVAWIRDHVEKEKQFYYSQDIIEIHPELQKEVRKMIPVSQNPEENKDYIRRVFIGFGPEVITYVAKNSREDVIREAMRNSEEKVIQQVMQNSEEKVIQQVMQNSEEKVIQQVMQNSKKEVIQQAILSSEEEVIQQLVEKKGAGILDEIRKHLDSKKKD